MDFFNEVESEVVRVLPNGVSIKVKAKASALSNESYEDAWLKAQEKAKADAEKKMIEVMAKLEKGDSNITEVVITGPPGPMGLTGNRGAKGAAGSDGKDLKDVVNNITTKLTLPSEVVDVINAIKNKEAPTDPCENMSILDIRNLFSPITEILNQEPMVVNYKPEENLTDLSLTGDSLSNLKAAFGIVFSSENKNKLLCLAQKNVIIVNDETQGKISEKGLVEALGFIIVIVELFRFITYISQEVNNE
jgi:hypothetical protein